MKIDHKMEVKRVLKTLRDFGFKVIQPSKKPRPGKWYGYKVTWNKTVLEAAVLFDNLAETNPVEVCLAVGNKIFWSWAGEPGKFVFALTTEDFELLLAGAMYDKVPTRELYNDKDSIAFVVTMGSDGRTRIEGVKP